jgi:hypothetical protein
MSFSLYSQYEQSKWRKILGNIAGYITTVDRRVVRYGKGDRVGLNGISHAYDKVVE